MTALPATPSRRTILRLAPALFGIARNAKAAPRTRREPIRVISQQPNNYHAWATLARRRDGQLLASYSGGREGHKCPFGRIELLRSRDDGRTWSWPQVIMDTPIDDRDSGIIETSKGTMLVTTFTSLHYESELQKAKGWDEDRLERWNSVQRSTTPEQRRALLGAWMLRSTDAGLSWSLPYRVPLTTPHGPITLGDGRLLFAGKQYPGEPPSRVGVAESTDDGLTWKPLAWIPTRPGDDVANYHELHAVETAGKQILVHIRNQNPANNRETLQSESSDGGRTWSVPRPIGVWGLPSHLLRLADGRLLMTYGYRRPPRGNHARLSEDHGRTWSEPIVLSDDGTGDIGYPSTVQLASGELLTLWYESRHSGDVPVKLPEPPFAVLRLARWSLVG
ncbi:MAG: sialidase family protein [Acidobacteria bacterium]|nr:sialidase family protein [Acidobacteriota bacterium]